MKQAGGAPEAARKVVEVRKAGVSVEVRYDVVIVGSGFAGLTAAVDEAEHGASVEVLEKMSVLGGASAICGGQWAVMGSKLRKDKGAPYDPTQAFVYDLISNGNLRYDLTTLKVLAENAPPASRRRYGTDVLVSPPLRLPRSDLGRSSRLQAAIGEATDFRAQLEFRVFRRLHFTCAKPMRFSTGVRRRCRFVLTLSVPSGEPSRSARDD